MAAAHTLPDVLQPGLSVVFCGSAAGERSAALGAYYAGPGNSFWLTLHSVGLTPRLLAPSEFRTLPSYGIGLTDIAKFRAGADSLLVAGDFDVASFCDKIEQFAPRAIAFNGKKAASVFFGCGTRDVSIGLQSTQIGGTQVWVLPSTSGSARGFWDTRPWHGLAKSLRE